MNYAIQTDNVSKSINGKAILNNISIMVKHGEIYGFLGANGAGKTSLMKTLYRIMIPTSGMVSMLGEEIANGKNAVFSRIGSIIETPVFYGNFNARKNLELHCGYMGIGNESITDTLSLFGISETGNKPVKNYSLGMKQRLALARAFLAKPELLILDEPINGLDPQGIIEIRELMLRINREYHTTIFISSHILDELSKIADTIGIIDNGSMLAEISMAEIKSRGIDLETFYLDLLKGAVKGEQTDSVGA
jgi:ABC-2 type transport system ATP-binding protein